MNGFILESKKIIESDIWKKPPLYFKVWHYLLLNAMFKDTGDLKRGQLFTNYNEIREACSYYVGYRKITPSKQDIHRIFEWLRSLHEDDTNVTTKEPMIRTTKVTHGMIVTIVNYNVYQDFKNYERNSESDDERTTNGLRKLREGNNIKKEEERRKNNNITPYSPPLKDWKKKKYSDNEELDKAIHDYIEYRKAGKAAFTDRAFTLFMNKLEKLGGSDEERVAIINQSIERGWTSVFALKDTTGIKYRGYKNQETQTIQMPEEQEIDEDEVIWT